MIWGDGLYLCSATESFGKLYQHQYVPHSNGVIVRAAHSHILKGSQGSVDAEHCLDPRVYSADTLSSALPTRAITGTPVFFSTFPLVPPFPYGL